jgi:hypothetical protein
VRSAKVGAVLYVLWGLLHLGAAYQQFGLASGLESGMVKGKIAQGAWDLMFFALACIAVAVLLNWRNSRLGYWLNLGIVSVADIGFLIFVFAPGYEPAVPGIFGPVLWVLAGAFTSIGYWGTGNLRGRDWPAA